MYDVVKCQPSRNMRARCSTRSTMHLSICVTCVEVGPERMIPRAKPSLISSFVLNPMIFPVHSATFAALQIAYSVSLLLPSRFWPNTNPHQEQCFSASRVEIRFSQPWVFVNEMHPFLLVSVNGVSCLPVSDAASSLTVTLVAGVSSPKVDDLLTSSSFEYEL